MATAKRKKKKSSSLPIVLIALIVIVIVACFVLYQLGYGQEFFDGILEKIGIKASGHKDDPSVITDGDVQIHFLEVGNQYTGDCTYIKVGDTDILIDAGSRKNSIPTISAYIDQYVTDGKLEYVIATHAHQDHIAGFSKKDGSIFDLYECENIITFALTNTESQTYKDFQSELADEVKAGANWKTAAELRQSGNYIIDLGDGITMTILDNKFYYEKTSDENDYSVCCLLEQGNNKYLFTGDLEKDGEKSLVTLNELPQVDVFKGAHHGSYTASSETLLSVIQPEIVCVCCCTDSTEYTKTKNDHTFPAQEFCDRVSKYTDRVYCTTIISDDGETGLSMNGNITVIGDATGVTVHCSNNDTVLKDTEWFKSRRVCPAAWK